MGQGRVTPRDAAALRRGSVRLTASAAASPLAPVRRPARWVARRWPRVALLGVVLAVAFGVLSMHDLVRPMSAEHLMTSAGSVATGHAHRFADDAGDTSAVTSTAVTSAAVKSAAALSNGAVTGEVTTGVATVVGGGALPGSDDMGGCASCGHHPSAMALCLLVLSLLLLAWRRPRLRLRLAPPTAVRYAPSWVPAPREPRPPSLAELAVCRT